MGGPYFWAFQIICSHLSIPFSPSRAQGAVGGSSVVGIEGGRDLEVPVDKKIHSLSIP